MNRPHGPILRIHWLALALVFLLGVAVGLTLARAAPATRVGDTLTWLALIILGLCAGAALAGAGWLLGTAARPGESRAAASAPELAEPGGEQVVSPQPQTAAAAPAGITPEPRQTTEIRTVSSSERFQLLRDGEKWIVRAKEVLGYESVQVAVGVTPGWWRRAAARATPDAIARSLAGSLRHAEGLGIILFLAALALYTFTRLFALDRFPINFFADEANQVVVAMDLVKRGFRDAQNGELFPLYFKLVFFTTADISVYFHALTASLFGKSIEVARGTSALTTILAASAVAVAFKTAFRARTWWAVVLLVGMMPTWLLFSRTTFDAVSMASLYALCVAFYLLYRYRSPRYLFPTVLFGAAAFYAYPTGQSAIGLLALLLLISDVRYHWAQRRTVLWAILLAALCAIPFIRFEMAHPNQALHHLQSNNSYWTLNTSLGEKLRHFTDMYLRVLSPAYWFFPNDAELMRHRMQGYGALQLVQLPLLVLGAILCLRHFDQSKYRVALFALLVTPVGEALLEPNILRALSFFFPAGIICAIGLEWLLNRLRNARVALGTSLAVFGILAAMNLGLLNDALTNGPTWYKDYTLYGMQWGAKQLFVDEIPKLLRANPGATVYVTHTWANGTDIFMRFFGLDPARVQAATVDGWINKKLPLSPNALFITAPEEYEKARTNAKFKQVSIVNTIPYPDGRPGFYVARLAYADNVDAVFAAERAAQRQLVTETLTLDGQAIQIAHTRLDMGNMQVMFDGDGRTVARGIEANPFVLDLKFPTPRTLAGLTGYFGKTNFRVTARLYANDAAQPVEYRADFKYALYGTDIPAGPPAEMNFDRGPATVTRLTLEIAYPESDETAHAHIFDLKLR